MSFRDSIEKQKCADHGMILVVHWLERLHQWWDVILLNDGIMLSILASKPVQKLRLGIKV